MKRFPQIRPLCLALLLLSGNSIAGGQITLSQDFDSGSLDVAASSVVGNNVSLVGRETWTTRNNYRWVYFEASNVNGATPQFSIDSTSFLGSLTNHRYVYSYDQENWEFFDNGGTFGGNYQFSNNSPFIQNDVYIAYGLPYPVSRTDSYVQNLVASPHVSPTTSANSSLVLGQSAAGVDDVGRIVPTQNLYGFKITDSTSTATKQKVLLASGSHSAETAGNYVLEGLLDFLLSGDSRADALRQHAEFFVYPQTNPAGRFGGYYRSNPENPDKDFNRFFNNPTGFTDLTALTSAMQADTSGDVDVLLDFHSWWGPWTNDNFIYTLPSLVNDPFFSALQNYQPEISSTGSNGQPGMLRIWGSSTAGLNAELGMTPEIGFQPFVYESDLLGIGESFGQALYDTIVPEPTFPDGDFNMDFRVDGLDLLAWQTSGLSGADLTLWEAHYGEVGSQVATASTVPEPAGLVLLLIAVGTISRGRDWIKLA